MLRISKALFLTAVFTTELMLAATVVFAGSLSSEDDNGSGVNASLTLPVAQDLQALGRTSHKTAVPILLMFASESCDYCKRLERDVLEPLRKSGIDPGQVIVRKVMLESAGTIRDFDGKKRGTESYGREHGVDVVPTVALVDEKGVELVPKLVGYQDSGFYEAYLDEAIKASRTLLQRR
jgi:thioredoxin-related protein